MRTLLAVTIAMFLSTLVLSACGNKPVELELPEQSTELSSNSDNGQ